MKSLLIVLLCYIALAYADCDQSMLIPSAAAFGNGWDSQKLTFLDLPLLSYTCDKGKKYTPPGAPTITWQVPDQLNFDTASDQQEQVVLTITKDYHEELKDRTVDFSFSVSIPLKIGTLAFQYGLEYEKMHQEMTENDRMASFSFHYWKTMTGESYPPFVLQLDPIFQEALDLCPATVTSFDDWQHYIDVVNYYGTHRAIQSSFGGLYHLYSFANQSLLQTHDQKWLSQQFSLSFHFTAFNISPGLFANISQITQDIDSNYAAASTTDEFYRGGDPGLQNNQTILQWTQTISAMPAPLNTTFDYNYKLVKDPAKQANMKKLVSFYEQYGCLPTDMVFTPCKAPQNAKGVEPMNNKPVKPMRPIHRHH